MLMVVRKDHIWVVVGSGCRQSSMASLYEVGAAEPMLSIRIFSEE